MERLPNLESCLRLAYEARGGVNLSGIALASYFSRAPTRGRRRSDLEPELIFSRAVRDRLGPGADRAIRLVGQPETWRACERAQPAVPIATREWLAEAALALGRAEGRAVMWALLRAMSELENVAQRLTGSRNSRATVREVLHGVGQRTLRAEPFAALLVRVLKISQAVYAAFRHAGLAHDAAWERVEDRLWSPHPTGRGDERGAYLPSLVQAASGNAHKRLRRNAENGRTAGHAQALLARFASGPGAALWPWRDGEGKLLPQRVDVLAPDAAGLCFFVLLTHVADERRNNGGPAGGLSAPFEEAGFSSAEWLPDRTDDLAVRLLAAGGAARGDLLEELPVLLRATLDAPDGDVARQRLPAMLRWLEENGRELLETP